MFGIFKKRNVLIAHRGYHKNILENSLNAFKKAKNRFGMIEFDVKYTKDFVAIVFHDNDLKRLFNKDLKIDALKFSQIKHLNIPTLDEVLKFIKKNRIYANLEIKEAYNKKILEDILKKIKKFKVQKYIIISSFEHEYLKNLKGYYKAALFDKHYKNIIPYLKNLKVDAYHVDIKSFNPILAKKLLKYNIVTNVYTSKNKTVTKKLFLKGAKGVFSDVL